MANQGKRRDWLAAIAVAATGVALAGAGSALLSLFRDDRFIVSELSKLANTVPIIAAVLTTTLVILGAGLSSWRQKSTGPNSESDQVDSVQIEHIRAQIANAKAGEAIPFEVAQLAGYYSLTLGQARTSFWFSLIFAAVGFVVIVGGAALYTEGGFIAASIKIFSGVVIDAVSALFFVQSRRAQESMSAFFEKLRNDRQFVEARKICEELSDANIRDHLKTILVLHYSGLASQKMIDVLPHRVMQDIGPRI